MKYIKLWTFSALACVAPVLHGAEVNAVECVATADNQAQLRTVSGEVVGDSMSPEQCQEIAAQAPRGFVCGRYAASWRPVSLETLKPLGHSTSRELCVQAISAASSDLVCSPLTATAGADGNNWKPIKGRTGVLFGRFGTSLADCRVLTAYASPGLVCTNTGTYNFRGRKPTIVHDGAYGDKDLLGASGNQAGCTKSTHNARNNWLCVCNGDYCEQSGWLVYNAVTRKSQGPNRTIDACVAAAQAAGGGQ